jgi:hypothetical protein
MSDNAIIDIGIACAPSQSPDWWNPVMALILETDRTEGLTIGKVRSVSSALPDHNKNNTIGQVKRRWSLTDANRNEVINQGFIKDGADWIFWIDDDTVPPPGTISRLIMLGREFVAGLYFYPRKPYNPIAYKRQQDSGLYYPVYNYPKGALIEVDSVGMGCTLIHRTVYEEIQKQHIVFERQNGSLFPVHKSNVRKPFVTKHDKREPGMVRYGEYREKVTPMDEGDDRPFPFYLLEHGRTEDHHFCELAESVGVKPYIDTTITCEHWKMGMTTEEDYEREMELAESIDNQLDEMAVQE